MSEPVSTTDRAARRPQGCVARYKNPGRGARKAGMIVLHVYLQEGVATELRKLALKKQVSMSEQLRQTIDWGLAALEGLRD